MANNKVAFRILILLQGEEKGWLCEMLNDEVREGPRSYGGEVATALK